MRPTGEVVRAATVSILLVILLILPGLTAAQQPVPTEKEPFSLAALGIKGILTYKNFAHFYDTETDTRNFRNEGSLQVEWARQLTPWSNLKIVVEVREDDDDFVDGVTLRIPETNEHRSILNLKEAVANIQQGPIEVMFGKQFFAWGTADFFNPTDNINPYDYLDPIDNEKLAVPSVAARWTTGPTSLTAVLVPVFTPSRTPFPTSRWVPPPPPGFTEIIDDRELPPRTVENMEYAARLRTTVKGWDLSVSYFEGFEHTPVIRLSTVEVAPGDVRQRITPVFTRMRVPGFDFSTTYRKIEFHGEGAFKLVDENGRDNRFQGIVGLNYTWDDLGVTWLERMTLIVEYGREEILSTTSESDIVGNDRLLDFGVPLLNRAARDALIGRLLFLFNDRTQLQLTAALDFSRGSSQYIQVKSSHKVTDALHVEGGFDFFNGDRDTFWGRWTDNDRFFLALRYFF